MKREKKHELQLLKEIKGNIWDFIGRSNVICITINLYFKNDKNIMGAGIAKEAKERYPELPHNVAFIYDNFGFDTHILMTEHLTKMKNNILTGINITHIIGFPTKPAWVRVNKTRSNILPYYRTLPFVFAGKDIPGYMGYSDLELIKKSAKYLKKKIELAGFWNRVILPKPGCSHGGLQWNNVKEALKEIGLYQMKEITFIEKG
jgi:hypothetical protein